MLQGANAQVHPKSHNSELQNLLSPLQIKPVKVNQS